MILNRNGNSGYPCLVPDFRGKFFSTECDVSCGFVINGCYYLEICFLYKNSIEVHVVYECCCCSVTQSCPTLCDPMNCSTPSFPVLLPELAQTHVNWVTDTIQPSRPLSSPSSAFNLTWHQGVFQLAGYSNQTATVLELKYQSFQWVFRVDFL